MTFKEILEQSSAALKQFLSRTVPMVRQALVSGGAAGAIAVAGIRAGDQLVGVFEQDAATAQLADLTAEFAAITDPGWIVQADGYINNTGGTDTSGNSLLVTWLSWV